MPLYLIILVVVPGNFLNKKRRENRKMKAKMQAAQEKVNKNVAPWLGGLAVLLSILGFLGAFMFNRVVAAPSTYQTIEQHQRDMDKTERRQERIEKKIDDGFTTITKHLLDLKK